MKNPGNFDYQGARNAGYSDEEILGHLSDIHHDFDIEGAKQAGYSPQEINQYLASYKPETSKAKKAGRIAGQYGLGVASGTPLGMAWEASAALGRETAPSIYRENLIEDIKRLQEQKSMGIWDDQDEALYHHLQEQLRSPEAAEPFVHGVDVGLRGLAEKATGADLHPEGMSEKIANWAGFLKNPKKLSELFKLGIKPKDFIKAITPEGKELARGAGAGIALQMAEEENLGPVGTMAAAIAGDLAGGGVLGGAKGALQFAKRPKETLAKGAAALVKRKDLAEQRRLIQDLRQSGIQADVGTLTNSELVKMFQARLAQSGLVGNDLKEFSDRLREDIVNQYKNIADRVGSAKFHTQHEMGEALQTTLKRARDADLADTRQLYESSRNLASKPGAEVVPTRLAASVKNLENKLTPGSLKGTEQKAVLKYLEDLKADIFDSAGNVTKAPVEALINNKIAINDIINYEVQGGQKQLLRDIAKELDKAILQHGKADPKFARDYINANKKFSEHAKIFRNKRINQSLLSQDPATLLNKMNTVQGIRDMEKALVKTAEGRSLLENLKRYKLDQLIEKNMLDNVTNQLKLGKFVNVLESKNNREIVKELLPPMSYVRLNRLQKSAGKIMESANKYYNASKSGTTAIDAALLVKVMHDVGHLLYGNPWPFAKTAAGFGTAKILAKTMADPKFLKLVEDAILASNQNNIPKLMKIYERLAEALAPAMTYEMQNSKAA